jgi:membrane protease subunit (stomatin/prohibitin family)
MLIKAKMGTGAIACVLGLAAAGLSSPVVLADGAGAFIGGVLATKVVGNMERQTEAQEEQAYYAQRQAAQPVSQAAPAQKSAEQRLAELDKLAAGGYITKEEYKRKKQAILDSM